MGSGVHRGPTPVAPGVDYKAAQACFSASLSQWQGWSGFQKRDDDMAETRLICPVNIFSYAHIQMWPNCAQAKLENHL